MSGHGSIGNPISTIQARMPSPLRRSAMLHSRIVCPYLSGLQSLRSERELVDAEITLYEQEKEAIKQVSPRVKSTHAVQL